MWLRVYAITITRSLAPTPCVSPYTGVPEPGGESKMSAEGEYQALRGNGDQLLTLPA